MRRLILTALVVLASPAMVLAQLPRDGAAGQDVLSPTLIGERTQGTVLDELREIAPRWPFDQQRQASATGM